MGKKEELPNFRDHGEPEIVVSSALGKLFNRKN